MQTFGYKVQFQSALAPGIYILGSQAINNKISSERNKPEESKKEDLKN